MRSPYPDCSADELARVGHGQSSAGLLELNRTCHCWPIAPAEIIASLSAAALAALGSAQANLFADTGVFVDGTDLLTMQRQIAAIEAVAQLPGYVAATQQAAFSPEQQAAFSPEQQAATRGVLMGYDFHMTAQGPRLIEVNTNAGGAFLVQHMASSLGLLEPAGNAEMLAGALADMFVREWRLAGRSGAPDSIAIVDETLDQQYLYSDMLLAAELLRARFEHVIVADLQALVFRGNELTVKGAKIDLVYNRLTDFALHAAPSAVLRAAWEDNAVVLTPAPHHHALLANKGNLELLGNLGQLERWGASALDVAALANIPKTTEVRADNAEQLWAQRKQLFFKPVAGFGGRAAYRGAKLTTRVWQEIVRADASRGYVAQELVAPSERWLGRDRLLKFDVRIYTYAGEALALVARIYQGQTTNFRTEGGGFAPVAVVQ